jgi:hypothetical protein
MPSTPTRVAGKIEWSKAEREAVVAHGVDFFKKHRAMPSWDVMQQPLPPNRRRPPSKSAAAELRTVIRKAASERERIAEVKRRENAEAKQAEELVVRDEPVVQEPEKQGKQRRVVVRWTTEEREAVLQEGIRLHRLNGSCSIVDAQLILSPERRRAEESVKQSNLPFRETVRARVSQLPPEQPAPAVEQPAVPPPQEDIPPPPYLTLGEILVDHAVEAGASVLAGILTHETVREALRGLVATAIGKQAEVAKDPAADWDAGIVGTQPRVLVAGINDHMISVISDEFSGKLNLRFWKQNTSIQWLKSMSKKADIAIAVTGFMSHSAVGTLVGNAPKAIRHIGGFTQLKQRLNAIVAEQQKGTRH